MQAGIPIPKETPSSKTIKAKIGNVDAPTAKSVNDDKAPKAIQAVRNRSLWMCFVKKVPNIAEKIIPEKCTPQTKNESVTLNVPLDDI